MLATDARMVEWHVAQCAVAPEDGDWPLVDVNDVYCPPVFDHGYVIPRARGRQRSPAREARRHALAMTKQSYITRVSNEMPAPTTVRGVRRSMCVR